MSRSAAPRLAHFAVRCLHLVEQARVLDGDDGLGGEARNQLDLLVGERADLLAKEVEGADQLALLQHWDAEQGPETLLFRRQLGAPD